MKEKYNKIHKKWERERERERERENILCVKKIMNRMEKRIVDLQ